VTAKGDITSLATEQLVHTKQGYVGKVTKEMMEILALLEEWEKSQFIMIEGAPGIGKSVLLREITYRWGKKQLLLFYFLMALTNSQNIYEITA